MKITVDALWGNTFSGEGAMLPPATGLAPGPAQAFGSKPFAGIWVQNTLGTPLHSLGNQFTGLSNGIYTKRTSLKVTTNTFTDIQEYDYDPAFSGFGIRADAGLIRGNLSGPKVFQQSGLGNAESDDHTFLNCSKGIKATGMVVDYIKNNRILAGKGIEVLAPAEKAIVKYNRIEVIKSIGIEVTQPPPTATVEVRNNHVDITNEAGDGIGIQYNAFGLGATGGSSTEIANNEVVMDAANALGIQSNATNGITLKQNLVTANGTASDSRGFQLNSDFNSLLTCNDAQGGAAGGTIGFDVSDAEGTDYSCNSTTNMGTGVYFQMGSMSPEAFQETSFSGGDMGLRLSATAAIGTQTHKGNTWSAGTFGSFGAQHESSLPVFWNESRFTIQTDTGNYYPSLPAVQNLWFPQLPGTPDNNCDFATCPVGGPTLPNDEKTFGFDDGIADNTFTTDGYPVEIGWLAKRYLYRKLTRNPLLVALGSDYETFYNNESITNIGRFSEVGIATAAIFDIDQNMANQLDNSFDSVMASMESIASIDSQLVYLGSNFNLSQQRLQAMQIIDSTEMDIDSISALVIADMEIDAGLVIPQNNSIADSLILETNKQTVNEIFLYTLASGFVELDSLQIIELSSIALQCPLTGGSAVYEARSLLSSIHDIIYDDDVLCSEPQGREANGEAATTSNEGFHIYPNPAKGQVMLVVPEKFLGGEVMLSNPFGAILQNMVIGEGSSPILIETGQLTAGIYQVVVLEKGKKIISEKLVIVH